MIYNIIVHLISNLFLFRCKSQKSELVWRASGSVETEPSFNWLTATWFCTGIFHWMLMQSRIVKIALNLRSCGKFAEFHGKQADRGPELHILDGIITYCKNVFKANLCACHVFINKKPLTCMSGVLYKC